MISSLLLRVSTLLLLCGLVFGLMFLVGLYYRMVPAAGIGLLAKIQAGLHIVGAIVFPLGIADAMLGGSEVFVIVGSLIVLAAMALFASIVFRTAST